MLNTITRSSFGLAPFEYVLIGVVGVVLGLLTSISPLFGLMAVAGGMFFLVITSRPVLVCYLIIIATVLTSGMGRGGLIPMFIPNELVLMGSLGLVLPFIIVKRVHDIPISGLIGGGILILLAGTVIFPIVDHMLRGNIRETSEIFSVMAPVQYALLFLVFKYLPRGEADQRRIIYLMLAMAVVVAVVGLMQAAQVGFILGIIETYYPSSHSAVALELGRITSLLGAWNSLGTFLMLTLLLVRSLQLTTGKPFNPYVLLVVALIVMACMLASGSFASAGGLLLGIFIIEANDRKIRVQYIAVFFIGGLIAYFLFQPLIEERLAYQSKGSDGLVPQTLVFRFKVWREIFLPAIAKNWLFGIGPTIPKVEGWQWAESHYLLLLYRAGIVTISSHLIWVGLTLMWLLNNKRVEGGATKALAVCAFTTLIVLTVMAFTNEVFTFSGVNEYLWIIMGLVANSERVSWNA